MSYRRTTTTTTTVTTTVEEITTSCPTCSIPRAPRNLLHAPAATSSPGTNISTATSGSGRNTDDRLSDDEYDDWLSAIDEESILAYESGSFVCEDPINDLTSGVSSISISTTPTTISSSHDESPPTSPTTQYSLTNDPDQTAYVVSSQMYTGQTEDWALAGLATLGVHGSQARATRKRTKSSTPSACYVVFIGTDVGLWLTWDQCELRVKGVSGSLYAGYTSKAFGERALEYARRKGWTAKVESGGKTIIKLTPLPMSSPPVKGVKTPEEYYKNSLNEGQTSNRWYIVFRGRNPGIYRTYLEAALNVNRVSKAVYESFSQYAVALSKYNEAL